MQITWAIAGGSAAPKCIKHDTMDPNCDRALKENKEKQAARERYKLHNAEIALVLVDRFDFPLFSALRIDCLRI